MTFGIGFSIILLYQLTLELLLYLIHDNVDFTLFYCVRLKLDSRFNWGINIIYRTLFDLFVKNKRHGFRITIHYAPDKERRKSRDKTALM